jgi:hypothetical protein
MGGSGLVLTFDYGSFSSSCRVVWLTGRPYNEPGEVVTRHIMPKAEYDKIADRVTAKK